MLIKVYCEYDIGGQFGSNNNEEIFEVSDDLSANEIEVLVINLIGERVGFDDAVLEGDEPIPDFFGWEYVNVEKLGE